MKVLLLVALCACTTSAYPSLPIEQDNADTQMTNLFAVDSNRAKDGQIVVDYQDMASKAHPDHDNAHKPLFTSVDSSLLGGSTYAAFQALQDQFTIPDVDTADPVTSQRSSAIGKWIDTIKPTNVFISAWNYLVAQKISSDDYPTFKKQLTDLWFTVYSRNSVAGSSGFESVFVGETANGKTVVRLNNWIAFYRIEKAGKAKYHGWLSRDKDVDAGIQFMWGNAEAVDKTILLNSSPEAEFMAYTVCALAGKGECTATIDNVAISITAKTMTAGGVTVIDECYPTHGSVPNNPTTTPHGHVTGTPSPHGDADLQSTVTAMRAADVDRATDADYTLNWGNKVHGSSDVSPNPLFTTVNENIFTKPVYAKLINIYKQKMFTPDTCVAEPAMTGVRKNVMQDWMYTMTNTTVFSHAYDYLKAAGKTSSMQDLQTKLFMLWFGTYSRCSHDKSKLGSSGWEHVFSGEWKGTEVDGHHNWINYYRQEKAGDINYYGYYSYDKQLTGTFQYKWASAFKKEGGFLIGTSPAFDFSLLSICVMTHGNGPNCKFTIDGFSLGVTSYTQACEVGTCIATAYPTD